MLKFRIQKIMNFPRKIWNLDHNYIKNREVHTVETVIYLISVHEENEKLRKFLLKFSNSQ